MSTSRKLDTSNHNHPPIRHDSFKETNKTSENLISSTENHKLNEHTVLSILFDLSSQNASATNVNMRTNIIGHMNELDINGIGGIYSKRLNTTHRNTRVAEEPPIEFTPQEVQEAIEIIRSLSVDLNIRIYETRNDYELAKI